MKGSRKGAGFLLMFLAALQLGAGASLAETVTLGVDEYSPEINFLTAPEPVARLVRAAVTGSLILPAQGAPGFRFAIGDSLSSDSARMRWRIRIRSSALFHNGAPVTAADAVFSLRSCLNSGILPTVVSGIREIKGTHERSRSDWLEVELAQPREDFPAMLADCPLLERRTAAMFGADLGRGSNIPSCGPFEVDRFALPREISMKRAGNAGSEPKEFTLRGFKDPAQALTALRTGTIDGFILSNLPAAIIEKAKKDETLVLVECSIYMVILRKGLKWQCPPFLDITKLRYTGG